MYDELNLDILVIGGGGAGLMAALSALESNPRLKIGVAAKGLLGQSGCTRMVQGGYNAVLDPDDSLERHFRDTITGGAFINNQELAWTLIKEAPRTIEKLEEYGCYFDRTSDGRIYQKAFAGQSFDRTVHKGDLTGIEIMSRLKDRIIMSGVVILDEHRCVSLLYQSESVMGGALMLDVRTGKFLVTKAKATLVATGGGARMYKIAAPVSGKGRRWYGLLLPVGRHNARHGNVPISPDWYCRGRLYSDRSCVRRRLERCRRIHDKR